MMKRTILSITFACCALFAAAQEGSIPVKFKGAQPNISDFAWAYVNAMTAEDEHEEEDECDAEAMVVISNVKDALARYRNGQPQPQGTTLTVDIKNGYLLYEDNTYDDNVSRVEACFWNESDGKHKLFAFNRVSFQNGKYVAGQYDWCDFCRYTNATKKMLSCDRDDLGISEGVNSCADCGFPCFKLPRKGKNLTLEFWSLGKTIDKTVTLKWNGRRFTL